jgi:hypothetical protein
MSNRNNTQVNRFVVNLCLPRAGLGNMLILWARAVLFAEINSFPVIEPNWNSLRLGPWLRGERVKRYYGNFFSTNGYLPKWQYKLSQLTQKYQYHHNPIISKIEQSILDDSINHAFIFNQLPPWDDLFQDIKEYQALIKNRLFQMIKPNILHAILERPAPQIGIHIRLGDYQAASDHAESLMYLRKEGVNVNTNVSTSLNWYIRVLNSIRLVIGSDIPATVFSDGYPSQLSSILDLPNVSLSLTSSALSDLITLSRSKIIIASATSSFSSWASYLGECPKIITPSRSSLYEGIFVKDMKDKIFEGGYDPKCMDMPKLLEDNIFSFLQEN